MSTTDQEAMTSAQQKATGGCCPPLVVRCVTEFIGCMIFICTISNAVKNAGSMAGLAIGSCLMVLIYMTGHVSGGHLNPAVSLGIFIRLDEFSLKEMLCYWVSQIGGAVVGALLSMMMNDPNAVSAELVSGFQRFDARMVCENKGGAALLVELVYTFLLVYTVLNVATSKASAYENNSFFALAIGFSVVVGAYSVGSVSGGAFNPAVQIGLHMGRAFGGYAKPFKCIHLLAGNFGGGLLAGLMYKFVVAPYNG